MIRILIQPEIIDLIPNYLHRRGEDMKSIQQFIRSNDFDSIQKIVHKMSGSGGMYGFNQISERARSIEISALNQDMRSVCLQTEALEEFLSQIEIICEHKIQ